MVSTARTLLQIEQVSKHFPGVQALRDVSFDVRTGEIFCLVGENGAGKSTLLRILAGVYPPDHGRIIFRGRELHLTSPAAARRAGISIAYQDTRLIPDFSVAENIVLGREPTLLGFVQTAEAIARAQAVLQQLGFSIDVTVRVGALSLGEKHFVEIARALVTNPEVLLLDEPTTGLEPAEIVALLDGLRKLQAEGKTIILVSHRLREVLAVADRISVLKDGQLVGTIDRAEASEDLLVRMMTGRPLQVAFPSRNKRTDSPVRLEVREFASPGVFAPITARIHAGEIVGLGGIEGNGQREFARALFGLLPTTGQVLLDGQPLELTSPRVAIQAGIVYLSHDRHRESLFLPLSIRENVSLPHLSHLALVRRIILPRAETALVQTAVSQVQVRAASLETAVESLSGGNQQKTAIARWLVTQPRVFIFDEPTQGIDVASKFELYELIRKIAARGAAVILLSTEVTELIGLCDRVLVFAEGQIVDDVPADALSEERIIGSAVGATATLQQDKVSRQSSAFRLMPKSRFTHFVHSLWFAPTMVLVLVLLIGLYATIKTEYFLTSRNLSALGIQLLPLAIVALGQTATLLVGGIDLSVGPLMSLATALASFWLASSAGVSLALGTVGILSVGLLVGLINGLLCYVAKLPDLIATLATYSVILGTTLLIRPSPGGLVSTAYVNALTATIHFVPVGLLVVLALFVIAELLLQRGKAGRWLLAVGSNAEAAYIAGIPISVVKISVYAISGVLASVAGLVLAARIGSGDPQAGSTFTLASVTAAVVGGTSIFGGRGSFLGSFVGALLLIELQNALAQLHVSAYWQYVWIGILTLASVVLYSLRRGQQS